MPRLLLFCPCESVLFSQGDNASLIVILHTLILTLPPEVPDPIPENSATQMKWHVFAQWECAPAEVGQQFEQEIKMVGHDVVALNAISTFTPEAGRAILRSVANLTFFPLVPAGSYRLVLSLRRAGEQQWQESGTYPVEVQYQR